MARNKAIYFDIDDPELKRKFQMKCLLNGTTQKAVLTDFIKQYVQGPQKGSSFKITPIIKKGVKGVKVTKKF